MARLGLLVNAVLVLVKLLSGIVGHSYALVADAIESAADIFSSLIVWGGLRISSRSADAVYPYGYGKAEPLAAVVVALMLMGAAIGISIQAVREIGTPHVTPAPFTLGVLVGVIVIKELLFRRVLGTGLEVGSRVLAADAWHHRSDALTSLAAGVGISVALIGGEEWAEADDWAALVAAGIILVNGSRILWPAVGDLMDRRPDGDVLERIRGIALEVPGVQGIESLKVRRSGLVLYFTIHVEADPEMPLREAHILSGMVKSALRSAMPEIQGGVVHMEPFGEPPTSSRPGDVAGTAPQ